MKSAHRLAASWAVIGLWAVIVPLVCLLAGGAALHRAAQTSALRTAVVKSAATLTAGAPKLRPTTRAQESGVVLQPPTATASASVTAHPTEVPEASPTPAPSATRTRAPSASPTVTFTQEPTATDAGEFVIGHSVAGRPLTVTTFGSGPVVRLIVAGIHGGNEWNTTALSDELIAKLRAEPESVPAEVTLYVLRLLNPDGAARGTGIYARANDNNVDLNRNWPSRWQPDWSRSGCWRYLRLSGGTEAGSEPETQALMQFMRDYQVDAVISYHSAALGIFAGGQPPDETSLRLAEAVAAVSDYPWPPLDFGCVYTGQLIDWASEQGIAALDVELTNHRETDLDQNLRILDTFLAWRR